MRTDLFTVQKDDIIELVAELMDWHNIRYMPVEDKDGHLSGLVSSQQLIKYFARKAEGREIMVKDIMIAEPIIVEPETTIIEAMELMREHNIGCLPVVQNGELIGLIEELDFLKVTVRLINRLER
ncbi:MAG: CBS domain-containing protein [Saprospiraceae bacterium]|nr:CBS domain-containing protein [Saprospiraceae bacterium]